jgi:hypothetical protein
VLLRFLPYLGVALGFLVWRVFIFDSTRPTTDLDGLFSDYLTTPWHMLGRLISETVKDTIETIFLAWTVPFNSRLYPDRLDDLLAGAVVGLAAAVLVAGAFWWLQRREHHEEEQPEMYRDWLLVGGFAVLATLFPLIAAGRDVNFGNVARADHYTIQASFGAVILLVGLFSLFVHPKARLAVLVLVVGASVYTHFQQDVIMRDAWEYQKRVWWQLSWRAPGLRDQTLLFVNLPSGFSFQESYEAWAPANFIYAPESDQVVVTGEVLDIYSMQDIIHGGRRVKDHRSIKYSRNYNRSLILSLPTSGSCLSVLDPTYPYLAAEEDSLSHAVIAYSRVDQIDPNAPAKTLPVEIFGPEPTHDWCYYFQKAQLARQQGNWAAIADLADEVLQKGYTPREHVEWMVMIEGYANAGRVEDARNLAFEHLDSKDLRRHLCARIRTQPSFSSDYNLEEINKLVCDEK